MTKVFIVSKTTMTQVFIVSKTTMTQVFIVHTDFSWRCFQEHQGPVDSSCQEEAHVREKDWMHALGLGLIPKSQTFTPF